MLLWSAMHITSIYDRTLGRGWLQLHYRYEAGDLKDRTISFYFSGGSTHPEIYTS